MSGHSPHKRPLELIVMATDYLGPLDLFNLIQGIPHVVPHLNSQQIQVQDKNGHTILYHIVEKGLENLIKPLAKWIPQCSIPDNEG